MAIGHLKGDRGLHSSWGFESLALSLPPQGGSQRLPLGGGGPQGPPPTIRFDLSHPAII